MNKKLIWGIGIISGIAILLLIFLLLNQKVKIKEYQSLDFRVSYDTTWKLKKGDNFLLEHKKSGSTLSIQSKELESYLIDTNLKELTKEITSSIEEQKEGFSLISVEEGSHDNYQSFSYLYEKGEEQALVTMYKKDTKLVIAYYVARSTYYDIVLDSVDSILDSLEILVGEK